MDHLEVLDINMIDMHGIWIMVVDASLYFKNIITTPHTMRYKRINIPQNIHVQMKASHLHPWKLILKRRGLEKSLLDGP